MTTELVTFKLEKNFLKDVDTAVKKNNFSSRTDFIRDALREKLEKIRYDYAVIVLYKLKGISKTKTTDEEYERIRNDPFRKIHSKEIQKLFRSL